MTIDWNSVYLQRQQSLAQTEYSLEDKQAITRFLTYLEAQGVGKRRLAKYAGHFIKLSEMKLLRKDLALLSGGEIDQLLKEINSNQRWKPWTKHDYQLTIKKFYQFTDGNSERAGRIRIITPRPETVEETECLTEQDILAMEGAARTIRDKTIVRFLFETGARVMEFLTLRISDAQEKPPFIVFHVHGTKNKYADRKIPINNPYAVKLFKEYLEVHPNRHKPDAALWINFHGEPLEARNFAKFLSRIAQRAGIGKKVNPHWFRHSRITDMRTRGVDGTFLEQFFGWCKGSDMLAVYDHSGLNALMNKLCQLHPEKQEVKNERTAEQLLRTALEDKETMKVWARALAKKGLLNLLSKDGSVTR